MKQLLNDIWMVFSAEVRRVFSDKMVLLIFFIAPIIYPLIFCCIYMNENVEDLPVAVVDEARCPESKRFVRKLDATPQVNVDYKCCTMAEAEQLMREHKAHAIFYFPKDFSARLAATRTAHIGVFCDMSSFYYYQAALLGGNNVLMDEMHTIELERFEMAGLDPMQASVQMQPVVYESHTLFNPSGGYGSFFLPILLLLVVHQTLFLGICILCGDSNETRKALLHIPPRLRNRRLYRVTVGRAVCYLMIYAILSVLDLWLIPRWFHLPQIGNLYNIMIFILPLLLAVIFFATTIGNLFVRQKISPMLCFVYFSVVIFFLSGMVWPHESMPRFWQAFSYIFPATPGVQGFVKLSSMGASMAEVRHEYMTLWIQAGIYFITACFSLRYIKKYKVFEMIG